MGKYDWTFSATQPKQDAYEPIIDKLNPKIILIENVARFFKMKYPMDSGFETIEKIINDKYGDKYNISCSVYNAADYGVPQIRKRVIIMGVRKDITTK